MARDTQALLDQLDPARLARHEQLVQIWRGLPLDEILADLNVLVQLAAFYGRQERVLAEARLAHAQGATHDCGEWYDTTRLCQICGVYEKV